MTAASHWRSPRNTRLWSALIGSVLLAIGFRNKPARDHRSRVPKLRKGGPGAGASTPARIAVTEIAKLFYQAIGEHRVISIAAGVTFFALLAMFPAVAALVSIYGLFGDPGIIKSHLSDVSAVLPGGAIDVVGDQLTRVASGGRSTLGAALAMSLALSLWSANAGMKALFDALNIVYGATERRGLIKLNAVSLAFTTGALLLLLLAMAAVVVLPRAMEYLGAGGTGRWAMSLGRWPALFALVALALALMYRFGPDRDNAQWHWITWGSASATVAWLVASLLFSWYAENFGSYNKTYGSLGAAIGFMTWIWISSMVILAGAELDAVMERLDRGTAK